MRILPILGLVLMSAAIPISATAQSSPSGGARLAADAKVAGNRADEKVALSNQWRKGAKMAADGEKLMHRSEARLLNLSRDATRFQAKADLATAARTKEEASLADGQRLMDQGHSLQDQAEAHFLAQPA